MQTLLNIYCDNTKVGELSLNTQRNFEFQYDEDWLKNPNAYPLSIALPLSTQIYLDPIARPFFENLLPETIIRSAIYPKRMNFRCRHCEAHHVDLYYDNIYGLKQSRVLRPFLDCFTSAVATVRNDAPFKHHLKMKRFEYSAKIWRF